MRYGDMFNLRLTSSDISIEMYLDDSTPDILKDLGFASTTPANVVAPKSSFGLDGDFAMDVISADPESGMIKNKLWEKISVVTNTSTTGWWFKVGSVDASYRGWGWKEAAPRVITGSAANPTFTPDGSCSIAIGDTQLNVMVSNVSPSTSTLDVFVNDLNTAFNSAAVNALAIRMNNAMSRILLSIRGSLFYQNYPSLEAICYPSAGDL
jgi:hypothetical protein